MKVFGTSTLLCLSVVGLAVSAVPARADAILNNLTITSGVNNLGNPLIGGCKTGTTGGTLTAGAGGVFLDFGTGFGSTTEMCGAHLVTQQSGGAFFTGTTLNQGVFTFKGAICELQGNSVGCNPSIPGNLSDLIQLTVSGTSINITDTIGNGGSFNITVNGTGTQTSGTPEPTSFLLFGTGLLAFALIGRRFRGLV